MGAFSIVSHARLLRSPRRMFSPRWSGIQFENPRMKRLVIRKPDVGWALDLTMEMASVYRGVQPMHS